jgi:epoxyqueuosine reductase
MTVKSVLTSADSRLPIGAKRIFSPDPNIYRQWYNPGMVDPISLSQLIDAQGWSFHGIVDFESAQSSLDGHRSVFDSWVKKGFHADMDYLPSMAKDRYMPVRKLPEAKSALILAAWYGYEQNNCSISLGKVARYAGGRDYHKILKKKLIQLSEWLKSQDPTAETYVSVDSGPLADRALAEAAGLGFFGKNASLIHPSKGSYFFIASLLTTLDLGTTPKMTMPNCGDCLRCQTACPTGALKGGGVVDSNLCIAYLTIENKGPIPIGLRPKIGNRLFGCDICQEVCPFNVGRAKSQTVRIPELKSGAGVGESLDLVEILSFRNDEAFLKRFAGTPLMRAKRFGLVRNACVVAGNSRDRTLIPILRQLIESESDGILKEHAEWALSQLS